MRFARCEFKNKIGKKIERKKKARREGETRADPPAERWERSGCCWGVYTAWDSTCNLVSPRRGKLATATWRTTSPGTVGPRAALLLLLFFFFFFFKKKKKIHTSLAMTPKKKKKINSFLIHEGTRCVKVMPSAHTQRRDFNKEHAERLGMRCHLVQNVMLFSAAF